MFADSLKDGERLREKQKKLALSRLHRSLKNKHVLKIKHALGRRSLDGVTPSWSILV